MSRYVNIEPYEDCVLQRHYRNSIGECIMAIPICGLPTADVQEVKHGKWIETSGESIKCSVCDDLWGAEDKEMVKGFNYCPYCGARMV